MSGTSHDRAAAAGGSEASDASGARSAAAGRPAGSDASGGAALLVRSLGHRYPGAERPALIDVSLRVEPGERLGLLGPNGAGKSTLMRLCCGFLPLVPGPGTRVELCGIDVVGRSRDARACVGYLPEHVPLYHELRAREHLGFRARIKGVPRRRRAAEIARVAERTGIAHVLEKPIGQLSRGYRQRVGVADALLGDPPVVILDEPTVGLDPNQVRDIRAMLRALGGEHTLVFSSHILAEVEMLCDRVVILSEGRVVADEDLAAATAAQHVVAAWEAEPAACRGAIERAWAELDAGPAPVDALVVEGARCCAVLHLPANVVLKPPVAHSGREPVSRSDDASTSPSVALALAALGRASLTAGAALVELRPGRTRLEERFAEVTGATPPRDPATASTAAEASP